ncbi:sigma-54-dependent Fis family transcriptional regulator [Pseudenhygromyxa sp. WMMC2535]|uniref:sigma-54-dependent transcriptional regulator n=1 Tax=Pseudenhygromyxa sp. WMMC2535 TaxID=2712867 RepID=UPI001552FD10|nr:sigma-54 dependent transcriptional regulator [Pseudenhygromyxa sp. WMMC2535]NVB36564.1 sigma-54-dependent Fis family transcriptional regulator [Pseudenhygromyxa sp. WMMC2535]
MSEPATLLVVDDEPGVRFALSELFGERGHRVIAVASADEALAQLDEADAILSDLNMPGKDGLALLVEVVEHDPSLPVVLLTAHGSERVAVQALKAGAYDYLAKPFDIDELTVTIERALETRRLRVASRRSAVERLIGRPVIAESPAMRRLLGAVERVATRDVTVLVRGETGTGKELIGQLVHAYSPRAKAPLVRFNCAAIPAELAESELFGHGKGAFTGATAAKEGFFGQAQGGTLVLDEIGEMPMGIQATLLRALQDGEIQPVGRELQRVDVRVVATTNADLAASVRAGQFREDLFYRLAVVELVIPPLRERREDIPALASEFARRYGEKFGLGPLALDPELVDALAGEDWPGNVRQLENTIARLAALAATGPLTLVDYREHIGGAARPANAAGSEHAGDTSAYEGLSLREQVEAFERGVIARALVEQGGNQSATARALGVSRASLIDKLKKYGLLGAGR